MINNCSPLKKEENHTECVESEPPEKRCRFTGTDDSPPTSDDEDSARQQKHRNTNNNICINSNTSLDNYSKDNEREDTDNSSSSSQTEGHNGSPSYLSKPYSLVGNTSASAHVRSCARFPLLTQGLKQMTSPLNNSYSSFSNKSSTSVKNANNFNNNNTNNKPEVKGLAALMNPKKRSETSRDRLFKSIKGLPQIQQIIPQRNTFEFFVFQV